MPVFRLSADSLWMPEEFDYEDNDIVAVGGDLSIERLVLAYRLGIFPWYNEPGRPVWFHPVERAVLYANRLKISKSMRAVIRKNGFSYSFDQAFRDVLEGCREGVRVGNTWMHDELVEAYCKMHEMGMAHSVEVWHEGKLVGGLYGMSMGRVFFGESMFSRMSNASKYAFIHLSQRLAMNGFDWIDCQVMNNHLATLGAEPMDRYDFIELLREALEQPSISGSWAELAASNTVHLPSHLIPSIKSEE